MEIMSSALSLPPGYRFTPTDEELVSYYLWRKVHNQELPPYTVVEMDVYAQEPCLLNWDRNVQMKDEERYYFVKRERMSKNSNGKRPRRELKGNCDGGWWKANTGDIKILDKQRRLVGYMKSLTFFSYKNSQRDRKEATKTNWIMHEYSLASNEFQEWVLCRIKNNRTISNQKDSKENAKENVKGNMNGSVALMEQRENGLQNIQLALNDEPQLQQQQFPQILEDTQLTTQEPQAPPQDFDYGAILENMLLAEEPQMSQTLENDAIYVDLAMLEDWQLSD